MKAFAEELGRLGVEVTSQWMYEEYKPQVKLDELSEGEMVYFAQRDLAEIDAADVLILFTVSPETPVVRAGSIFEAGYAFGQGKKLLIVGPRQNIFLYLPEVARVKNWKEAKEWVVERMTVESSEWISSQLVPSEV